MARRRRTRNDRSTAKKQKKSKPSASTGPYSLWYPPPNFQEELKEFFKDVKIDTSKMLDPVELEKQLKGLEEQLKPFAPRPISPETWNLILD